MQQQMIAYALSLCRYKLQIILSEYSIQQYALTLVPISTANK
jgi:hypothetical protein